MPSLGVLAESVRYLLLGPAICMISLCGAMQRWKLFAASIVVLLIVGGIITWSLPDVQPNQFEPRTNTCGPQVITDRQCAAVEKAVFLINMIICFIAGTLVIVLCCLWEIAYRLYRLIRWKVAWARIAANGGNTGATADHGDGAATCDPSMIH